MVLVSDQLFLNLFFFFSFIYFSLQVNMWTIVELPQKFNLLKGLTTVNLPIIVVIPIYVFTIRY